MLRLKRRQREVLVDKLPDLANLIAGTLIFGQLIAAQPFSPWLAVAGVALWALFGLLTLVLDSSHLAPITSVTAHGAEESEHPGGTIWSKPRYSKFLGGTDDVHRKRRHRFEVFRWVDTKLSERSRAGLYP
jgi:hypothetical protein